MHSSDDLPVNGLPEGQEEASCSVLHNDSDKNANISNQSKGAIPKVKPLKRKSKLNNNNELVQNGVSEKPYQMHNDVLVCDPSNNVCNCVLNKPSTSCKDVADSSSSDENELLSISDDGCIYTYKADDSADLPSSFYNLNIARSPERSPPRRDNGSPEMDFLEMDFDPGPSGSGDADSDSLSTAEGDQGEILPQDPLCNDNIAVVNGVDNYKNEPPVEFTNKQTTPIATLETSNSSAPVESPLVSGSVSNLNKVQPVRMPWSCLFRQRTSNNNHSYGRLTKYHHSYNGELSYTPTNEEYSYDRKLEQVMIWSDEEACRKQKTQIAPSSCGATAVINVLNALRFPIPTVEEVQSAVQTRYRANSSPLAPYLLSRSVAGSTHEDIIAALNKLSDNQVYSRFFHMYPERVLNLNWWLQYWISQGAVPITTLNLQKCVGSIPDAWHHQMVFGVGPCGVYLTNPLECVKPELLWPQLSSESILLIRREDILNRWYIQPSLDQLMGIRDRRWTSLNVVGQVANMVCESHRDYRPGFTRTPHIKIPASYSAGITLSLRKDSPACQFLQQCPELPLLPSSEVCSTDIF